jgi:dipeptidyl aminopeptidase/acylaminoacyl peptidase
MRPFYPEDIYRLRFVSDPQISPDGAAVAYTVSTADPESNRGQTQIRLVPAGGGPSRPVTAGPGAHSQPRWSPDGKTLAFVSDRAGKAQVFLLPLGGGEAVQFTAQPAGAKSPAWSPDGRHIAYLSADVPYEQPAVPDLDSPLARALTGSARTFPAPDVRVTSSIKYKADTRGLFPKDPSLWVADLDGAAPMRVPARLADGVQPVWSPCGRYIALAAPSLDELESHLVHRILLWDREAPEQVRVLHNCLGPVKMMAWAPDGGTLAFVSHDRRYGSATHNQICRLTLAAGPEGLSAAGEPQVLTGSFAVTVSNEVRTDSRVAPPATLLWSPDGRWLYFVASERGSAHLFRVAAGGGAVERVTPANRWVVAGFSFTSGGVGALQVGEATRPDEIYAFALHSGDEPRRLTDENGPLLAEVKLADPIHLTARAADGQEIEGWLLEPYGRRPGEPGRWPMVLEIHGGPHGCWGWTFHTEFQAVAAQGYAVLYLNPRGSHAYSPEFTRACVGDWGGQDYGDLMTGVDVALERFPWIDPDRLGVTGNSYGGFMTSWMIGSTDRFKAAVVQGVVANQLSMFGTSDIGYHFNVDELGADPWSPEGRSEMIRRSPVFLAPNVTCPVLVVHAEEDHRCPIGQGEELFTALKVLGKTAAFVRYPGEDHLVTGKGRPRNRVDRLFRVVDWFRAFIQPGSEA